MIKIYHASDLHVRTSLTGIINNRRVLSLLKKISDHHDANCASHTAVAVITGDLTDSGSGGEHKKLKQYLDTLDSRITVRVVPGNHDNGGGNGTEYRKKCAERFDDLSGSLGFNPKFIKKYKKEYPGYTPFSEEITSGPGGAKVKLIYLNSCCEEGMGDFATGTIGMFQLNCLKEILTKAAGVPCIICLHHKPADRAIPQFIMDLSVEDRKGLVSLAKEYSVSAILYGHQSPLEHDASFIETKNGGKCELLNANASVSREFFYEITVYDNGKVKTEKI